MPYLAWRALGKRYAGHPALDGVTLSLERGRVLALDPTTANRMMTSLARQIERCAARNLQPVVLCSAPVRPALKKLADRFIPNLFVLSYDEILSTVEVRSLGSVELNDAD